MSHNDLCRVRCIKVIVFHLPLLQLPSVIRLKSLAVPRCTLKDHAAERGTACLWHVLDEQDVLFVRPRAVQRVNCHQRWQQKQGREREASLAHHSCFAPCRPSRGWRRAGESEQQPKPTRRGEPLLYIPKGGLHEALYAGVPAPYWAPPTPSPFSLQWFFQPPSWRRWSHRSGRRCRSPTTPRRLACLKSLAASTAPQGDVFAPRARSHSSPALPAAAAAWT
mmetsp:Transcript_24049/g.81244  ORF Transcript_24049/g.81244 Transcript_24049/m.81244 type:complete len:222 (+) Transcript_24049:963-1628(+)